MKTLAFFFALVTAAFADAPVKVEPIKVASLVVNGREYKQASITKFNVSVCRVVHSDGAARIPMNLLSSDLQKKLGYDPEEERVERENSLIAEAARKQQAILDAIPFTRFWVSENNKDGLIVGNFTSRTVGGGAITGGLGRVGGGGNVYVSEGKTILERGYEYSFIPHTDTTKNMACESEFEAKVTHDGTIRIDEDTVVAKYKILEIK